MATCWQSSLAGSWVVRQHAVFELPQANIGRSTFYEHYRTKLVLERLEGQATGASTMPVEVIARQIAQAQLSLVDSWVLGRPHMDLDMASDVLRRTSLALAGVLAGATGSFTCSTQPKAE
ncbi:hypothetical protein [Massilia pseudoviolaceinigra]|uniref:hypothetical protein n=1 Tax=Massilia pseudoviolaceinigra TaxID=3057165 RepID=UPI002796DD71|nr:hypothetical protein [Massilia sp. CCM 9206]MDQ1921564.1 hypothetical protein [Massilia sp. CCM 9206]